MDVVLQDLPFILTYQEVQIFEPDGKYAKEAVQCSMCESALTKTVLYLCESGHVVCEACRTPDDSQLKPENGNAITSKLITRKPASRVIEINHEDLASGDHTYKRSINQKSISLCLMESDRKKTYNKQTLSEEGLDANNKKTTLKYINDNFCDSDSSISSEIMKGKTNHANESQRPVKCPVTECHKIIARDSVLQHFYFDHSKVPRTGINESECHEVLVEPTSITENVTCYAVLLINADPLLPRIDSRTVMSGGYKNSSFLLMGARMLSAAAEIIKTPRGSESVPKRHVQTQTGAVKIKCSKIHLKSQSSINVDLNSVTKTYSNNDGDLMLWICQLGDINYYYNISVTSADKKKSFSATGESVNIRDSQDGHAIWNQFDHLHIRGKNINKFTNKKNQMKISINIFK